MDDPRRDRVDDPRWASAAAPVLRIWKPLDGAAELSDGVQRRDRKEELELGLPRADAKNYYATKILITKPGPLPNAGLVRYAMVGGHELDRVQLPLPLTLERGSHYRVRVSVQDDHFVTYLNGQVISSWSDKRLLRGGVGFFDDADDPQKVAWVNVSERDSFLGRMLAHFSLIVLPRRVRLAAVIHSERAPLLSRLNGAIEARQSWSAYSLCQQPRAFQQRVRDRDRVP